MKTAESKIASSTTQRKSVGSFFKKDNNNFLGTAAIERVPFFTGLQSNNNNAIQAKLSIGQPNDKYEQEADAMADKVVQRLSLPGIATKKETSVQAKTLASTITPLLQTKCATCKQEDTLQKKEENEEDNLKKLQRKPIFESNAAPPDEETNVQRKCAACEKEEPLQKKSASSTAPTASSNIEHSINASKGSGSPIPTDTKAQMENSFGADFSSVRLHTNTTAVQMNNSLNAQAFTHGNDIYFNAGKYDTNSSGGKHLLAHELTHTVQQGVNKNSLQRQVGIQTVLKEHGESSVMPVMNCFNHFNPDGTYNSPNGEQDINFSINSAGLSQDSLDTLQAFRDKWRRLGANATIELNGYASIEGGDNSNWILSCNRAKAVEHELTNPSNNTLGIPNSFIIVFANGETNKFGQSMIPNRIVTLISSVQIPHDPVTEQKPKCGPDSTHWFVTTVNGAMVDPRVLSIKKLLRLANLILSRSGVALNTDTLAEAGSFAAIIAQFLKLGSSAPVLNPTVLRQLSDGKVSVSKVLSVSKTASSTQILEIAIATTLVGQAALKWKDLVNHGAPYDFKAHIMNHPKSSTCPDDGCVSRETGVITLCPGAASENCYESDITGNIFYALIGGFIGWSKLTLQLGSQLAELTDTRVTPIHPAVTWDTPDDTFAIDLGFGLPLPLSDATFCKAVGPSHSSLSIKTGCTDCTEIFH